MKKKRYIVYFLFLISIVMLIVPVIPHHHHDDGLICMKNDLPSDDCCTKHQTPCNDHCCCDTGCMTVHFLQKTPTSENIDIQPDFTWVTPLFSELIFKLSILLDDTDIRQNVVYFESLHGTFITRATGLRAPPSILA